MNVFDRNVPHPTVTASSKGIRKTFDLKQLSVWKKGKTAVQWKAHSKGSTHTMTRNSKNTPHHARSSKNTQRGKLQDGNWKSEVTRKIRDAALPTFCQSAGIPTFPIRLPLICLLTCEGSSWRLRSRKAEPEGEKAHPRSVDGDPRIVKDM